MASCTRTADAKAQRDGVEQGRALSMTKIVKSHYNTYVQAACTGPPSPKHGREKQVDTTQMNNNDNKK